MTKHGLGWGHDPGKPPAGGRGHDPGKLGVTTAKTGGAMMPKNSAPKWGHDPG